MGTADMIIAAAILGVAAWLLHRSVWKKKGHCHGCSSGCCGDQPRSGAGKGTC